MTVDLTTETLWQEDPNAIWCTNVKPVCNICGRKSDRVAEMKISEDDEGTRACFLSERDCMRQAMALLFSQNPDVEFLWTREIEYKSIAGAGKNKATIQREPVGLSKRYNIMKRDGFQCVLCGANGKDAKLEIDHIVPVSAGGSNSMDNLRTLCFECNRGNRDQIE